MRDFQDRGRGAGPQLGGRGTGPAGPASNCGTRQPCNPRVRGGHAGCFCTASNNSVSYGWVAKKGRGKCPLPIRHLQHHKALFVELIMLRFGSQFFYGELHPPILGAFDPAHCRRRPCNAYRSTAVVHLSCGSEQHSRCSGRTSIPMGPPDTTVDHHRGQPPSRDRYCATRVARRIRIATTTS